MFRESTLGQRRAVHNASGDQADSSLAALAFSTGQSPSGVHVLYQDSTGLTDALAASPCARKNSKVLAHESDAACE